MPTKKHTHSNLQCRSYIVQRIKMVDPDGGIIIMSVFKCTVLIFTEIREKYP